MKRRMTTQTTSLTDFLLARIAEDEAVARASDPAVWVSGLAWRVARVERSGATAAHIARHDPARVLAESESKRAIVEVHYEVPASDIKWSNCGVCMSGWPCVTLRHLAAVYADHPDYDPTWRP